MRDVPPSALEMIYQIAAQRGMYHVMPTVVDHALNLTNGGNAAR